MGELKNWKMETSEIEGLDKGIARHVDILRSAGIETFESCEGGEGHIYPVPTIRFHGGRAQGFRALSIALEHGLRVKDLRRTWDIIDGDPTGPYWELVFYS